MKPGEKIITLLATGFFTGYFPLAPATFSTLTVGIGLYFFINRFSPPYYGLFTLLLLPGAIWLSDKAEHIFQRKDSPCIVIDEVVGFLITMFLLPREWYYLLGGFITFRFFDIIKPPPAHFFNKRKKGGLDVVMDDVVAGIYANLLLQIARYCVTKS